MNNNVQKIEGEEVRCGCLALTKALIGISELYLAEQATKENAFGSFRLYKAVQTYYVVFNLIASYIVINDKEFDEEKETYSKVKRKYTRVDLNNLNSDDESSETWNNRRKWEQDLITLITHSMIKAFSEKCRENASPLLNLSTNSAALRILYDEFIDESSDYKYEKLCYIRDRAIYRPSHVVGLNGDYYQTSKDVRSEIDSLPNSEKLLEILLKYVEKLVECQEDVKFYFCSYIRNEKEYLKEDLRLSDSKIIELQNKHIMLDDYSVPDYFCHLLELENADIAIELYEKFWIPIKNRIYG